jgi:hypothetical protein
VDTLYYCAEYLQSPKERSPWMREPAAGVLRPDAVFCCQPSVPARSPQFAAALPRVVSSALLSAAYNVITDAAGRDSDSREFQRFGSVGCAEHVACSHSNERRT